MTDIHQAIREQGKLALWLFKHPQNKYWGLKLSECYQVVEVLLGEIAVPTTSR